MAGLESLLADLREQRTYRFMEPWRLSSRSLGLAVPIVRTSYGERAYILLDEIPGEVDVRDSGSIRRLIAKSRVDKPVFVRGGLILKGETQPRAVRFSVIIFPGEVRPLEALCVHDVRPITVRALMTPIEADVSADLVGELTEGDQLGLWRKVAMKAHKFFRVIGPGRPSAPSMRLARELPTDLVRIITEMEKARRDIG
ncbi:hypothetical protein DRO32_03610, partial [Candidatus Bathyarchaeota archaeon]